jgi:hypothetical protein
VRANEEIQYGKQQHLSHSIDPSSRTAVLSATCRRTRHWMQYGGYEIS